MLKASNSVSKSKGVRKDFRPDSAMYETLVGRLANIWVRHTGLIPKPSEPFNNYVNQILVYVGLEERSPSALKKDLSLHIPYLKRNSK
jgi:hypothetical protein